MVMKHHPHPGEMLKELVFTPLHEDAKNLVLPVQSGD